MNNQMPMGFMPNFNNQQSQNEFLRLEEKVDNLQKRICKLEKKVESIENNSLRPMPYNNYNMPNFPTNYIM